MIPGMAEERRVERNIQWLKDMSAVKRHRSTASSAVHEYERMSWVKRGVNRWDNAVGTDGDMLRFFNTLIKPINTRPTDMSTRLPALTDAPKDIKKKRCLDFLFSLKGGFESYSRPNLKNLDSFKKDSCRLTPPSPIKGRVYWLSTTLGHNDNVATNGHRNC